MSVLEPGLMGFYQPLPEAPETKDLYEQDFDDLIDRYARKMGFSKKHFEAFARQINALHQAGKHAEGDAIHGMVLSLNDNPRFQPERFKTAAHKGMDLTGKSQYCESCGTAKYSQTFLESPEDMKWLEEVHKVPKGHKVAILHGNEDAPHKVELFKRNHVSVKPTVMEPDEDGNLKVTQHGD